MTGASALWVRHEKAETQVDPSATLSFGRDADLVVDDNGYMHRQVGRFECRQGRWWLCNVGNKIVIEVFDNDGTSAAVLAPRMDQALPGPESRIRFNAGSKNYELITSVDFYEYVPLNPPSDTVNACDIPLTDSQRLLLVALAEQSLLHPFGPLTIPPTKEVARRLGWTTTKFNRKLDTVCAKLSAKGFDGLKGGSATVAADRRRSLVDVSLRIGLVDSSMLHSLDQVAQ